VVRTFTYARAVAPMLWVMVGLSSVELVVVHGLLAFWRPWIAAAASLVTGGSVLWLIAMIRSFPNLPVIVGPDGVTMRVGRFRAAQVAAANVAGLRGGWSAETLKQRDVLNMALIAYPNVVLELREPQRIGRRTVRAVAHRLDDPAGFAEAIEALGQRHD
jgi:hypothetical protein